MGNGNFAGLACRIIHGETEYGDLLGEVRVATLGGSTGVSTPPLDVWGRECGYGQGMVEPEGAMSQRDCIDLQWRPAA